MNQMSLKAGPLTLKSYFNGTYLLCMHVWLLLEDTGTIFQNRLMT